MDDPITKLTIGDKTVYLEEGWYTLDELQAYVDNVRCIEAQTPERKKVMKTIKSYFEPLTLTLVWVYAMAIFAVAMDIFVWRA